MAKTWKLAEGKTWRSKLEEVHPSHGKIVPVPESMQKTYGQGTMVVPKPRDVDTAIRKIRKGKLTTVRLLRAKLADAAGADHACPFTTGVFLKIIANAAEEARVEGKQRITPYWRVLKDDGSLNGKYPGGVVAQALALSREGHVVEPNKSGTKFRVVDYHARLTK